MQNPPNSASEFQCSICTSATPLGVKYICKECYADIFTDVRKVQQDNANQLLVNYANLEALENLKEEVEFLRKWSFTPGELASGTGDVNILCTLDGSLIHAHSLILSNKSEVFRAMLEEIETKHLQIDEAGGDTVKAFLKFLYTAQVSDEEMSAHYKELVKLAHFYQVEALILAVDNFISSSNIEIKDFFIEIINLAYLYDLKKTKSMLQQFISHHDPNNEFFDIALKELQAHDPLMAHQFSREIISELHSR